MNLEDIKNTVFLLGMRYSNIRISPEQFNHYLKQANIELFKQLYGFVKEQSGWEVSNQVKDSLRHFKTADTSLSLDANGRASYPADYFHQDDLKSVVGSNVYKVTVVSSNKSSEIRADSIYFPTSTYPICELNDTYIQFYPVDLTGVYMTYLRYPTEPEYVTEYDTNKGINVYDSNNSTELEWGDEHYIDIIRIILGYMDIAVGTGEIAQLMDIKQDKES